MDIRETMLPVLGPQGGDEEIDSIRDTIESGWWGKGPKVAQFFTKLEKPGDHERSSLS